MAYPVTAVVNGQPMKPYSDSYVITGVWAFMSFKWSVGLAYFRYIVTFSKDQFHLSISSHHYRTRLLKDREYNAF